MSRPLSAAAADASVEMVKHFDAKIAELQAERAKHIERLKRLAPGKHTFPHGTVTVSENNVYDTDAIVAALSPGQVKRCTKAVVDKAVVKRLYPEAYNGAKENRGYKVSVS